MSARRSKKVPGFYVAWGAWLAADGLHKVGHTEDLRRRLRDDAYVTAFPPGHWRYVYTFETSSKTDAARLEAAVLHLTADVRLHPRELVRLPGERLRALAEGAAAALGVPGTGRAAPVYPPPPPPRRAAAAGEAPLSAGEALLSAGDLRTLDAVKAADPLRGTNVDEQDPCNLDIDFATLFADLGLEYPPTHADEKDLPAPVNEQDDALTLADEEDSPDFADEILLDGTSTEDVDDVVPLEDRQYQSEAAAACLEELMRSDRAVLQMACRCGKTRVAHKVICEAGRSGGRTLYLVPGLALLRQTARKFDRYSQTEPGPARLLLVGSDPRPLPTRTWGEVAATTDPEAVAEALGADDGSSLLVVSTYQSSALLSDVFDLIVFDECHRACGRRAPRPFTHVLLTYERGRRLYLTATPRYDSELSMKDRELFGGIAYAYHMREGIDAGYVNPFSLELVGVSPAAAPEDPVQKMARAIVAAAGGVDKLLVFCRSIRHAVQLRAAADQMQEMACAPVAPAGSENPQPAGSENPRPPPFETFCAHSRMPRGAVAAALESFAAPGRRAILFNCRLFQEGVEIPPLNAVFFASPRHSPRDIIQSLCRPLNVVPGKPPSRVFVPVEVAEDCPPDDAANLKRFASIIPFFDALIAEDPLLYEHLLDPRGTAYPLRWVDSRAGLWAGEGPDPSANLRYDPDALLAAARRAVRRGGAGRTERLLRAARIPWEIGFGELGRIVRECGRYVKTTDCFVYGGDAKVNFGLFYRYARDCYAKWQRGEPQPLEPHQLRDLESLPGWDPYGIEGPYPWRQCFDFLWEWLEEHGGTVPKLEINCGGYVGIEATSMERLSGAMTCINQGDGRDRKDKNGAPKPGSGFTVDPEKAADLDQLCARWPGLRWRKERRPPPPGAPPGAVGGLVEDEKGNYVGERTFIQKAHAAFKAEWKARGGASEYVRRWFPGYPLKHKHQERDDVWARRREIVPPRWRGRDRDR